MPDPRPLPTYGAQMADLHDRYLTVKGADPTPLVAEAIGVSRLTLARFEREGYVTPTTLHRIATWVRSQEPTRTRLRDRLLDQGQGLQSSAPAPHRTQGRGMGD